MNDCEAVSNYPPNTLQDVAHTRPSPPTKLPREAYTIGWVCALDTELAAAKAMLEQAHDAPANDLYDGNAYCLGTIQGHNIVIAGLPSGSYGTNSAARVASNLQRSYPSVQLLLLVGIGGGVPGEDDVRLGDVVVSHVVVQHDLGKKAGKSSLKPIGIPYRPPFEVMTAVTKMRAEHARQPKRIRSILNKMLETDQGKPRPPDYLYLDSYEHVASSSSCHDCDSLQRVSREPRDTTDPIIHYGTIASGNQVVKHARDRNELIKMLKEAYQALPPILCIEMEAAGLIHTLPCLVIRGICDYSDSHKNKAWQPYAAATAAAYARDLLSVIPQRKGQHALIAPLPLPTALRQRLLASLRFDRMDTRHESVQDALSGTCAWMLQEERFLDWQDHDKLGEHHGFLWIQGKPGSGKSTLVKFLLQQARTSLADSQQHTVINLAFFFNARGMHLEKSTIGMYRSLLFQLLERVPELQSTLDDLPQSFLEAIDVHWTVARVSECLSRAISRLGQRHVALFIDALDECDEADQIRKMLVHFMDLGETAVRHGVNLRVCFSNRHYPYIHIKRGIRITLDQHPGHEQDMEIYVKGHLDVFPGKELPSCLSTIVNKSGGVFLWVVLVVALLNKALGKSFYHTLEDCLEDIPEGLGNLFEELLSRDNEDMAETLLCIQWILYAQRPLSPAEFHLAVISGLPAQRMKPEQFCSAISTGLSARSLRRAKCKHMDEDAQDRFAISSSKGLAEVTGGVMPLRWREYDTVQFIHESVRDFFLRENGIQQLFPILGDNFESASHNHLKHCCQAYMAMAEEESRLIDKAEVDLSWPLSPIFPLLDYAVCNVLYHANAAAIEYPQQDFVRHFEPCRWIRLAHFHRSVRLRVYTPSASLQYILSQENLSKLLLIALELDPCKVDIEGERDRFPLLTAVMHASEAAVRVLVDKGANIEVQDEQGRTALHHAAAKGYVGIAKLLLVANADFNVKCGQHGSPLHAASKSGHEQVVSLLLSKGADMEVVDDATGRTPLSWAAGRGKESTVRRLLHNKADMEAADNILGRTPLSWAAGEGQKAGVRPLLEAGALVNATDRNGRSPLSWIAIEAKPSDVRVIALPPRPQVPRSPAPTAHAQPAQMAQEQFQAQLRLIEPSNTARLLMRSLQRAEESARLLLQHGADTEVADANGRTPLSWAAQRQCCYIMQLLLDSEANPDAMDATRRTPLSWAAQEGQQTAVELLLEYGADPEAADTSGQTPLSRAANGRHDAVVRLLREKALQIMLTGGCFRASGTEERSAVTTLYRHLL